MLGVFDVRERRLPRTATCYLIFTVVCVFTADCKSKRRVSAASSKLDHDTNFEFAELLATMGNHFSRQPSNNAFEPEARMSAMSQKRFDHSMILEETTQDHVLAGNVDIGGIHQQSSANQKLSRGEMLRFLKNNLKGNV